jgi:hypothetical protein
MDKTDIEVKTDFFKSVNHLNLRRTIFYFLISGIFKSTPKKKNTPTTQTTTNFF